MSTVLPLFYDQNILPSLPEILRNPASRAASALLPNWATDSSGVPIIAFCHLSWDGVWQRPQQLLSRLSQQHPVLFVENIRSNVASSQWRTREAKGYSRVTVLEMHLTNDRWEQGGFIDRERRRLLDDFRSQSAVRYENPVLWFNDPMAVVAFAGHCGERAIVYDCMDELSQFKGAPAAIGERERRLLRVADVVFCGGRKMREKRLPLNANCHFYGTGVDCSHFGSARKKGLKVAPELAKLSGPVLGYFGVVDERIDYELLARLADADPTWHVVMVGPTAKIDPADLPQRANLHWLGARSYAELPALAKGFSVCLMPFALNEATEYINPTKSLEYMATGRPVVSTALDEVKTNFGTECQVATSHEEFIAFCRQQVAMPDRDRIAAGLSRATQHSWESTVEAMDRHIYAAMLERSRRLAASRSPFQGAPCHV